jgi:hypothetical protein
LWLRAKHIVKDLTILKHAYERVGGLVTSELCIPQIVVLALTWSRRCTLVAPAQRG